MLHTGVGNLQIALHHLSERGLVHSTPQGWVVTGFKESQAAPNSTERSRAFRKRRKSATQEENESNDDAVQDSARCATRYRTYGASEMQPSRHIPVSKSVPNPVSVPGPPGWSGKRRHRHRSKGRPVENPVDNFVDTCPVDGFPQEKGRKISDSSAPSSTSGSVGMGSSIKW
jgi:hypothetical protein